MAYVEVNRFFKAGALLRPFCMVSGRFVRSLGLVCILCLAGCATTGRADVGYLLARDYQQMSDPELTAYEQELSEAIAGSSGTGWGGTSIGFGIGSWGSDTGFGLGVSQNLGGGSGNAAVELRDRREAVRVEMRRRGLLPPTSAP